jgi:hypothetical protein
MNEITILVKITTIPILQIMLYSIFDKIRMQDPILEIVKLIGSNSRSHLGQIEWISVLVAVHQSSL